MPQMPGTSKVSKEQAMQIMKKKLLGLGAVQYLKDYFGKLKPVSEKKEDTMSNIKSHKQRLEDATKGKF